MTAAERLATIRARADEATPEPWDSEGEMVGAGDDWLATAAHVPDDVQAWRNATFIAAARADIPRLVAALEAVLGLHANDDGDCRSCRKLGPTGSPHLPYPCPTVRAIETALGGD